MSVLQRCIFNEKEKKWITQIFFMEKNGPFAGKYKTYGYLIAERNQMTVQHLAVGGQTMAMLPIPGTFSNSFSNGIYKTIDEDVDYITLYYGINISCVHYNAFVTGPSILLNFF